MFNHAAFLKIAADSPEQLRGCDVFRVLDECPAEHKQGMAQYIIDQRPDLVDRVARDLGEIVGCPIATVGAAIASIFNMAGLPNTLILNDPGVTVLVS